MSPSFIRTIVPSNKPINSTADMWLIVLETLEVNVIDCGAKYSG
jgi:hypothetical protein